MLQRLECEAPCFEDAQVPDIDLANLTFFQYDVQIVRYVSTFDRRTNEQPRQSHDELHYWPT
ncbi:hypothetical protein A8M60_02205 [Nocardia farcinica]|nr:hypothetical protein A8M60_02205 [Nocardia farcinica]